jgi:hypothetical protein
VARWRGPPTYRTTPLCRFDLPARNACWLAQWTCALPDSGDGTVETALRRLRWSRPSPAIASVAMEPPSSAASEVASRRQSRSPPSPRLHPRQRICRRRRRRIWRCGVSVGCFRRPLLRRQRRSRRHRLRRCVSVCRFPRPQSCQRQLSRRRQRRRGWCCGIGVVRFHHPPF